MQIVATVMLIRAASGRLMDAMTRLTAASHSRIVPMDSAISGVDQSSRSCSVACRAPRMGVCLDVRDEPSGERFGLPFDTRPGSHDGAGTARQDRATHVGARAASPSSWFVGCGSCSSTMCAISWPMIASRRAPEALSGTMM